eukprot:gene7165-biopygen13549
MARAWRGLQAFTLAWVARAWRGHGAGVARATGNFWLGVARAWPVTHRKEIIFQHCTLHTTAFQHQHQGTPAARVPPAKGRGRAAGAAAAAGPGAMVPARGHPILHQASAFCGAKSRHASIAVRHPSIVIEPWKCPEETPPTRTPYMS